MDKLRKHSRKQQDRRANRNILYRIVFFMAVFGVALFIPLVVQLWKIQITEHDTWTERAANIQTRDVSVSASRGSIYDASGRTLAMSATTYNLILSPKDLITTIQSKTENSKDYKDEDGNVDNEKVQQAINDTREKVQDFLSETLGLDADTIQKRLEKTNSQYEKQIGRAHV